MKREIFSHLLDGNKKKIKIQTIGPNLHLDWFWETVGHHLSLLCSLPLECPSLDFS